MGSGSKSRVRVPFPGFGGSGSGSKKVGFWGMFDGVQSKVKLHKREIIVNLDIVMRIAFYNDFSCREY